MNRFPRTYSKVSAISYPNALFILNIHPQLWGHTAFRRHSDSNPRIPPRGSNSLHPSDRSRWIPQIMKALSTLISLLVQDFVTILQLNKLLGITMGNLPTCQSQLQRLNQVVTRISRFKPISWDQHLSTSIPLPWSVTNTPPAPRRRGVASLILRAYTTPRW